jgi:DnaJ-class molecular chaperone
MACGGSGHIQQQLGPFTIQGALCSTCGGQGTSVQHNKHCTKCKGKKAIFNKKVFELKLPQGIPNHYEVVMEGKGSYNMDQRCNNDMRFKFVYDVKEPYRIDNDCNVHYTLKITIDELLAGFIKDLTIYNDKIRLVSEHYFNPTKTIVMEGKGLYDMRVEKQRDLHVHFEVVFTDNERFKKYADVLKKVLKTSTASPEEYEGTLVNITQYL